MTARRTTGIRPRCVRARAVRAVRERAGERASRWAEQPKVAETRSVVARVAEGAVQSIAANIGCAPRTLQKWTKPPAWTPGARPGVTTHTAARVKALERDNRELLPEPTR